MRTEKEIRERLKRFQANTSEEYGALMWVLEPPAINLNDVIKPICNIIKSTCVSRPDIQTLIDNDYSIADILIKLVDYLKEKERV